MDVFERVREVNTGASLTEDRISGARYRLLDGIDTGRAAERKRLARRPMFVIAGAVATVAAVTATVVVVNQPAAPDPRVEAVPVATGDPRVPGGTIPKPVPTAGATVAGPFPGTTPEAGQYLRVEISTESLVYRDDQQSFTWWEQQDLRPVSGLVVREVGQLYIPADRSGEWFSRFSGGERIRYFPDDQGSENLAAWDQFLPPSSDARESTSIGGFGDEDQPLRGSAEWAAAFPRDPQTLLDYSRTYNRGYEQTPDQADEAAVDTITDTLRSNAAPADLRQALMKALDLSGLAEVSTAVNGVVTYRIKYNDTDTRTDTISLDTATGWATQYSVRWDRPDGGSTDVVPQSVPDITMTYSVSIVNSVP